MNRFRDLLGTNCSCTLYLVTNYLRLNSSRIFVGHRSRTIWGIDSNHLCDVSVMVSDGTIVILVIKWKRVVIEYESPVDNLEAQFGQQLNIRTLSGMTHRDQCEKYKSILDNILTARTILSRASGASSRPSSMKMWAWSILNFKYCFFSSYHNLLAWYRLAEWKLKWHPTVRFTQQ